MKGPKLFVHLRCGLPVYMTAYIHPAESDVGITSSFIEDMELFWYNDPKRPITAKRLLDMLECREELESLEEQYFQALRDYEDDAREAYR